MNPNKPVLLDGTGFLYCYIGGVMLIYIDRM